MSQAGSVSQSLEAIKQGDTDAVRLLSDRYYQQLAGIARRKMSGFSRRVVDEYAIANDVLHDFSLRSQQGDFPDVRNRADLLPLLVRLTHDRVVDEVRRMTAQKRGAGRTRGHSIFVEADGVPGEFDRFAGADETPSTRLTASEEIHDMLSRLSDETMRAVLVLRVAGLTNDEISGELDVSLATVERKRRRIREILGDRDPIQ